MGRESNRTADMKNGTRLSCPFPLVVVYSSKFQLKEQSGASLFCEL